MAATVASYWNAFLFIMKSTYCNLNTHGHSLQTFNIWYLNFNCSSSFCLCKLLPMPVAQMFTVSFSSLVISERMVWSCLWSFVKSPPGYDIIRREDFPFCIKESRSFDGSRHHNSPNLYQTMKSVFTGPALSAFSSTIFSDRLAQRSEEGNVFTGICLSTEGVGCLVGGIWLVGWVSSLRGVSGLLVWGGWVFGLRGVSGQRGSQTPQDGYCCGR